MGRTQEHVDLDRRIVRIEASLVETAKGSELGPTKTAAGRRTVAISDVIVPDLRWHLQRFAEPGPAGRVFVGPKGASPRRNNLNAIWRKAGTDAGLSAESISTTCGTPGTPSRPRPAPASPY